MRGGKAWAPLAQPDEKPSRPPIERRLAVVILASEEVSSFADAIRRRHDPEWFARVPPHVSLMGPFAAGEADAVDAFASLLAEALVGIEPFEVELAAPDVFLVPELVLFLKIADEAPVRELHERVRDALPGHEPTHPYHPHLTVGRFASQEELRLALAELREEHARRIGAPFRFAVDEVHLFGQEGDSAIYQSMARVRLGARPEAPA